MWITLIQFEGTVADGPNCKVRTASVSLDRVTRTIIARVKLRDRTIRKDARWGITEQRDVLARWLFKHLHGFVGEDADIREYAELIDQID